ITETYDTAHPTLFDSAIVLSDGSDLLPEAEEFAEMTYKHKKPLVVNEKAANQLGRSKIKLNAPGVFTSDEPNTIVKAFDRVRYWDR
ncbi:catalase HPII, partial [Staphylococcus pseudintermedius]